ncbi:DUF4232 domain-containing protein [Streptomyces bluensis]|uniref:DUF4232 domain-containing protein n=1 Tax=Streptomyces bluensis TaxID=33897 RepID=UPI0016767468|nr:DUF4232 domain-containing protein [Streptomyces bluensis]GGZ69747.1 hypothetical protein GCM10010344_40870 [Streptomyces bluensis]
MIAIRRTSSRYALLVGVLALCVSGCGLSTELEREFDPDPERPPATTRPPAPPPAPPPASVTPDASPSVPVQPRQGCPPSGVRFGTGPVSAAMGLRAMTLTVTNCSAEPYELNGYPAVSVLDEAGAPLEGVRTAEGTDEVSMAPEDPGPEPLTLAPGETAGAGLYWRMAAGKGIYLRVAARKGDGATTVRAEDYLDIGPENVLGTTAWKRTP